MPDALTEERIQSFRQEVLEIAALQFASLGIDKVSMRSLARELGYSATALYSYFKNKDDILAALRARALTGLAAELEQAGKGDRDAPREKYVNFVIHEPTAYKLAFAYDQPDQGQYPELAAATKSVQHALRRALRNGLTSARPPESLDILVQLFWAGMHGLAGLYLANKLSPQGFERQSRQFMALLDGSSLQMEDAAPAKGQQFAFDL